MTLLPRRAAALWHRAAPSPATLVVALTGRAQAVVNHLRQHGASFYDEIVDGTGLLRTQVEEALAELVALGIATSDSFAGLRALLTPSEKRRPFAGGRRHRRALFGIEDAGRWALRKREAPPETASRGFAETDPQILEPIVHALLRRYGVVFWRILQREAAWLPPWRELLRVLRRLEARGDVRGGRFVAGVSGEQFALPDAVKALRDARRAPLSGEWVAISAADPLNLVGTLPSGCEDPGAHRQSRALSRRPGRGRAGGRRDALARAAGAGRVAQRGDAAHPATRAFGVARRHGLAGHLIPARTARRRCSRRTRRRPRRAARRRSRRCRIAGRRRRSELRANSTRREAAC